MDIIEILDDLEYERARPRKRQKVAPSSKDEVIELFDSDDEPPPPSQFSSFSGPSRSQTQAHNRPHQKPLPLFLEDFDELPLAGPSGAALDHIPERSRPAIEAPPLRREPSVILPPPTTQDVPVVSRDPDPLTGYVAQVLEIVPDVDPNYVLELVMRYLPDYQDKVVEPVLHTLFEDPSYPKVGKGKGKRKRDEEDEDEEPSTSRPAAQDKGKEKDTINYLDKNRHPTGGVHYLALAVVCRYTCNSRDYDLLLKSV